jgi:hypothetical protein
MARPSNVRHRRPHEERRPDPELRRAPAARDAGLRRVSRLTGWILAGTIALTGGLSEVAAHALPGHRKRVAGSSTSRSRPSDQAASAASASSTDDEGQSSATPDLQPPEQAPAPSDATGGAVSGGS